MGFEPTTFCMASASRRTLQVSRKSSRKQKDDSHTRNRVPLLSPLRHLGALVAIVCLNRGLFDARGDPEPAVFGRRQLLSPPSTGGYVYGRDCVGDALPEDLNVEDASGGLASSGAC